MTVSIPQGCAVAANAITFSVIASPNAGSFTIVAAAKPVTKPDWHSLNAFLYALLAGGVLAAICLLYSGRGPLQEMTFLDSAWSFNDSWVSNVTVVGGLLAGIFGSSSVVSALLGTNADASVALATVGVAIAAALVAAAPVVLIASKGKTGFYTVGGLAAAASLTLAGAAGELWVVYRSAAALDLGGWQNKIVYFAVLAFVLLGLYAFRSLVATIQEGTDESAPVVSDTLAAAGLIVAALNAHAPAKRRAQFDNLLAPDQLRVPIGLTAPRRPKRSALL